MYKQLDKLGDISQKLREAKSLLGFMNEHFVHAEEEPTSLMLNHKMYSDLYYIVMRMVGEQLKELDSLSDELYAIAKAIRGATS